MHCILHIDGFESLHHAVKGLIFVMTYNFWCLLLN